ncbi:MAG: glycosyltransferase family 4 protein [Omnitrophica WOR_2 bacterium]
MKILIANTRFNPGGGDITYAYNLAQLLMSKGHEVAFFAMQNENNLPDPNSDLFVSEINFRELNKKKNIKTGAQVLVRTIYSTEARQKFSKLIDRFHPDLIHLQNIYAHLTASIIFEASQRKLPMVWTQHDFRMACPNSHFLIDRTNEVCEACRGGKYYQVVLKRCKKDSLLASLMACTESYAYQWMHVPEKASAFLAPSKFLRRKLLENGFPPEKVYHLPLFMTEEQFRPGGADQGYLLFLGRIEHIKGVDILVEACRQAPSVKVILAGSADGAFATNLINSLPPNVTYAGLKHGDELFELISQALSIVLPSVCYENQPFSILEAFAAGKPVIASDLGGMTELVSEERGRLVKPKDPVSLAEAMIWMTGHVDQVKEMGLNAQSYAREVHTAEPHYNHLMAIYSQVTGKDSKLGETGIERLGYSLPS